MESSYIVTRKSHQIKGDVYGAMSITHNAEDTVTVLWNKFQVFVYENFNFDEQTCAITPDFLITQLYYSKKHLICLDCDGNVHTTTVKHRNAGQKRFKAAFQLRDTNVVSLISVADDLFVSVKYKNKYHYFHYHKVSMDFQSYKEMKINFDAIYSQNNPMFLTNSLICRCKVVNDCHENLNHIFNDKVSKGSFIFVINCNKSIFGCIVKDDAVINNIRLTHLYDCPTEVCNIVFSEGSSLKLIIGLKSGTFLNLDLNNKMKAPEVGHVNASLHKFIEYKDCILYTNGKDMWKCTNVFIPHNTQFEQLFLKQCHDFVCIEDRLIAVTFSNIIYSFSIQDENCIIKDQNNGQYPVESLLDNSDQLHRIMDEVDKNCRVVEKVKTEFYYITALSLASKEDLQDKILNYSVTVYENYEEIYDIKDLTLTNDMHEYFKPETLLFYIKLTVSKHHKLTELLNSLSHKTRIHFTFCTNESIIKTVTLSFSCISADGNILIPVQNKSYIEMKLKIKLIMDIPGGIDGQQELSIVVSKKDIHINSEQLIKTSLNRLKCLKNPEENLLMQVTKSAEKIHGNAFDFKTNTESQNQDTNWTFYLKLPKAYKEKLKIKDNYLKHINVNRSSYLHKKLGSDEFLNGRTSVTFVIEERKVLLQIKKEIISLLKIQSEDIKIAYNMRCFLSKLLTSEDQPQDKYVSQAQYTTIENMQRNLKDCLDTLPIDDKSLLSISESYYESVIGALPV